MRNRIYRNELLKQTDPYAYFLANAERKACENTLKIRGPLADTQLSALSGLETFSYTIPERSETYVILKAATAGLYDQANLRLLCDALKDCASAGFVFPDIIYCDHDYQDSAGKRHTPYLKPDASVHTLLEYNYIGPYAAVRKSVLELVKETEPVPETLAGEDLLYAILLLTSVHANKITHVTQTLFYLRSDLKEQDLYEQLEQSRIPDEITELRNRVKKEMEIGTHSAKSLSVIIPSKDHADILIRCLESIGKSSIAGSTELEILVIDNGSCSAQKEQIEAYIGQERSYPVRYEYDPAPFNFAVMSHRGAELAKGELLLFLNDDVELLQKDCLEKMAAYALSPQIGAVGAKLLFPDEELIQHVGVTNLDCGPTHKLSHHSDRIPYYFGVNRYNRNVLAVTGACLMVTREKYFQVRGFHDKMGVSYNDVDLCVKLYENGFKNVILNDCVLLHHESLSRGSDLLDREKIARLSAERKLFYECHPWLSGRPDPFYHPDLIQDTLDFRVNVAADYEVRNLTSKVEIFACPPAGNSKRLQLTIEETSVQPDLLGNAEPVHVLTGWSLYLKHDDRNYERSLLLFEDDRQDRCLKVSLLPVVRKDVAKVFEKQKHALLAGFQAKIPASCLKEGQKYKVALLYEHRLFHNRIITVGAYYEPGKGYDTTGGAVL